jgi:adenosine deaminase
MNILVCTLGISWAVVPESLAFLAPDILPLYDNHPEKNSIDQLRYHQGKILQAPDEIWVITSEGKSTNQSINSLNEWWKLLKTPLPLRVWQAKGTDNLSTLSECEHIQELIFRVCLLASEKTRNGQLILSLAGGRKTMSANMQHIARIIGCYALIHVIDKNIPDKSLRNQLNHNPKIMTQALVNPFHDIYMPIITSREQRSEILDIDMEEQGIVESVKYPVPSNHEIQYNSCSWEKPDNHQLLIDNIKQREQQSHDLMGNYFAKITEQEPRQNWRMLYRLPPKDINYLTNTPVSQIDAVNFFNQLPKAELHMHLGGCLPLVSQKRVGQAVWNALTENEKEMALLKVEILLNNADWSGLFESTTWSDNLNIDSNRSHYIAALLVFATDAQLQHNLHDTSKPRHKLIKNFKKYELPGELMGSAILGHPAAIKPYAEEICNILLEQNIIYCELRGSPQKYLNGNHHEFIRLFYQAIQQYLPKDNKITIRFIVIVDRRQKLNSTDNDLLIKVDDILKMKQKTDHFIVGIDLAGDEKQKDYKDFIPYFEPAFEACLPITIHAGEEDNIENIWKATYQLHADRIGHGLTLIDRPELQEKFRNRGICLEMCPSSNCEVVGYGQLGDKKYPLHSLWKEGIPITICTDNPEFSQTNLSKEYQKAGELCPDLTVWEALAILKQSYAYAFLPAQEKETLMKQVDIEIYNQLIDNKKKNNNQLSLS